MSVSRTPPDPVSRPLDALEFHIQHKHSDKIVQILNDMPLEQSKDIKAVLPKVGKAWEDINFVKVGKAVSKAVERKFVRLSVDNQTKVLEQVGLKKFDLNKTALIVSKIYEVEMLSSTAQKHGKKL